MSLVQLLAQADERGLAVGGLACLDRCLPLLGDGTDGEVLRPLWAAVAAGEPWQEPLVAARSHFGALGAGAGQEAGADAGAGGLPGEAVALAGGMLAAVPEKRIAGEMRGWAETASRAALRAHLLLDGSDRVEESVEAVHSGGEVRLPPLTAAELRRQIMVLELLADRGAGGLRPALDVSVEGRRVLRAALSRRARGRR